IPVFNQLRHTLRCLRSVLLHRTQCRFEIIVVDDCSGDVTARALARLTCVRHVRPPANGGFVRACNLGARGARGEFLVFLNNDTCVLDGWLDALVGTFANRPKVGAVGSKLLYPGGKLQEAGGIIWSDASGWNYGRLDDPNKPEYNYLREVDY